MALFVTGDTHGSQQIGRISADGFYNRFSDASFPEQKGLGKEDYVVICGDFGGVWAADRQAFRESAAEKEALDWLDARPFTTLFVPGNHENYDRLTGCRNERLLDSWFYAGMPPEEKDKLRRGYPRLSWHGGAVRAVRPTVLMLEREELFDLCGKACFAFGGARSHDIRDGILDPADYPGEKAFMTACRAMRGGLFRVRGLSWWDAEVPSAGETAHALEVLRARKEAGGGVDFIFTHDAPAADRRFLGIEDNEGLPGFLDALGREFPCEAWFYGHLHMNRRVFDNHYLLYEQILRIL